MMAPFRCLMWLSPLPSGGAASRASDWMRDGGGSLEGRGSSGGSRHGVVHPAGATFSDAIGQVCRVSGEAMSGQSVAVVLANHLSPRSVADVAVPVSDRTVLLQAE